MGASLHDRAGHEPSPKGLGHSVTIPCADTPLQVLLAKAKETRGPIENWVQRELILTRFIAGLHKTTRVFCRGEVRLVDKGHFPAVLTYNSRTKQTVAWAPSGRKDALEFHHEAFFWSNVPHEGIAREVLSDANGTDTI